MVLDHRTKDSFLVFWDSNIYVGTLSRVFDGQAELFQGASIQSFEVEMGCDAVDEFEPEQICCRK